MVYRRTGKSTFYRRRRFRKRYSRKTNRIRFAASKAKMSYRLKRFGRMMSQFEEKKRINMDVVNTPMNNSGLYIPIPKINHGSAKYNRTGNKIFIRYFSIRYRVDDNESSTALFRFSAVWPKRVDYALGDMPTNDSIQPWDLNQFSIIGDKVFPLYSSDNVNALGQYARTYTIPVFKSFTYDDNADYPDETTPLFYFWCNDSIAPSPQLYYSLTITYTDV